MSVNAEMYRGSDEAIKRLQRNTIGDDFSQHLLDLAKLLRTMVTAQNTLV